MIRPTILIIVLLSCVPLSLLAQFGVGARIGLGLGTMTGTDPSSNARLVPNAGFVTGVSGEFRLVEKEAMAFYLQPEFALQQKGWATRTSYSYWSSNHRNFDYLSLPISGKLMFGSKRFRGGFSVGVAPSLLIGANNVYREKDGYRNRTKIDRDNVRSFDINAFVSGLAEFELGPGVLFAELRYTQGLLDTYPSTNDLSTDLHAFTSISFGYVFRIGNSSRPTARSSQSQPVTPEPSADDEWVDVAEDESKEEWSNDPTQELEPSNEVRTEPARADDQERQQPASEQGQQKLGISTEEPEPRTAETTSDFEEMIALNKHFDTVSDHQASEVDKEVSKAEILSKFKSPDSVVLIQKNRVTVDYYSISEFLEYVRINHFRYKITDRERDGDGLINKLIVHRR